MMKWNTEQNDYDDVPVVCATHGRFVPCRQTDGRCIYTSNEHVVDAVSDYQRDILHDWYVPW